jgi:sec-independent protein translocase protein TatA
MIGKLGMPELLVIMVIALLVFGPRKIGELGKGLGEGIRGFKSALCCFLSWSFFFSVPRKHRNSPVRWAAQSANSIVPPTTCRLSW